eukprot:936770_1
MSDILKNSISVVVTGGVTFVAGRQVWLLRTYDVPKGIKRVRYYNFASSVGLFFTFLLFVLKVDPLFTTIALAVYNGFDYVALTWFVENVIVSSWKIVRTSPPKLMFNVLYLFRVFEASFIGPASVFLIVHPCKLAKIIFVCNVVYLFFCLLGIVGLAFGMLINTLQGVIKEYRTQNREYKHLRYAQKKMISLFLIIFTLVALTMPYMFSDISMMYRDQRTLLQKQERNEWGLSLSMAVFLSAVILFYAYHAHLSKPKRLRPDESTKAKSQVSTFKSRTTTSSTPTKIKIRPQTPTIAEEN